MPFHSFRMDVDLEDLMDEIEEEEAAPSTAHAADHLLEERLAFSDTRQLITAYLERRAIELGATERIEEFCAELQAKGTTSLLQMRAEVAAAAPILLSRSLRMEILQIAAEFVEKFMSPKENGGFPHGTHFGHQNGVHANHDSFYSDQSTTSSSVENPSDFSRGE
jgi:hypothetical protein